MSAPRPLPPAAHADERGDGFDVEVCNRAGQVIGYRQSLQTLRALDVELEHPLHLDVRPFRQPIAPGAEANLRLLLMRTGVFRDRRPDWAWAPLEQADGHFGIGAVGCYRWSHYEELIETVLPDEFLGVDVSGRTLRSDGLRVRAYGMTYEIRDRFRYVAFHLDERNSHIAQGAGWTPEEALADGRRRWRGRSLDATAATPGLMRALAEHGFGSLGICVSGGLAMLWDEVGKYDDEYWDYHWEWLHR